MGKKIICVVSGSRADYDLLKPVMYRIKNDRSFRLICLVTGSHLMSKYGNTYKKIVKDGFKINNKIKILDGSDTEQAILRSISKGIKTFGNKFGKIKPDAIIVLGDRTEILSAVISAGFLKIPILHLSGGEVSEGAIDENIRHTISKFSSYHFVANKLYKKRIIQLGENPKHIFYVGGTGPENIKAEKILGLPDLEKKIKFKFRKKNFLITYHSVTYSSDYGIKEFKILLGVLSKLKNIGLIFTIPNADARNNLIIKFIKSFVKKNRNSKYFYSLGQKKYFSCIKYVDAVIGNSSSGLSEVPSFKKATINIGKRQKGRIFANSIINCEKVTKKNIKNAINKIYLPKFKKNLLKTKNPYDNGVASKKIINCIKKLNLSKTVEKKFFDINFKH